MQHKPIHVPHIFSPFDRTPEEVHADEQAKIDAEALANRAATVGMKVHDLMQAPRSSKS